MPWGNDWLLLIWALICIVAVLGLSYWVTRLIARKGTFYGSVKRRNRGQMEVFAQELIGKDQRLMIARVGEKYFFLGVTPNAISMLAEISEDEANFVEETVEQGAENRPTFFDAFSGVLKEKMRR